MSSAAQETKDTGRRHSARSTNTASSPTSRWSARPRACREDTVRFISAKKGEPDWMLEWRLGAFRRWLAMNEPKWARVHYPPIDYQNAYYYAAPKNTPKKQSLDEVDPKLLETYKKLGIPLVRADGAGRRGGGRGVRFRLGRHHLQGKAERGGRDLLPDLAKRSATIPSW